MGQEILLNSLNELWGTVATGLPKLLWAIIIFIIGWIIAGFAYKILAKLGKVLKIDSGLQATGLPQAFERAGHKLSVGKLIGWLVKWFIVVAFLMTALDVLDLQSTTGLLRGIVNYIPQVIIAIFVFFAGFVVADFVKKLIKGSTKMVNFKSAGMLSNIARISVLVFTFLIVLNLLGIGREIVNVLFTGAVAMVALAGGLAFGLGGRDAAAKAIEKAKHDFHK